MNRLMRKRSYAAIVPVVIAAIAYACYEDGSPPNPVEPVASVSGAQSVTPNFSTSGAPSTAKSSEDGKTPATDRVDQARTRMAWVGEIHNMAMRDLTSNRVAWVGKDKRDDERVCRGIANLIMKYTPQIKSHAGTSSTSADDRTTIRRVIANARGGCSAVLPMNLFGVRFTDAGLQEETAAWEPYAYEMLNRIEVTDASVAAVTSVTNEIMYSASNLSTYDLEILAAVASTADASAAEWNYFGESGGFDGPELVEPLLMFARAQWWKSNVMKLVYSDVAGALGGAKVGGAAGAGWGGIAASGLFLISII